MPGRNIIGACATCCVPPPPPVVGRCESKSASAIEFCGFAAFTDDLEALPVEVRFYKRVTHSGREVLCVYNLGDPCEEDYEQPISITYVRDYSGTHLTNPAVECAPPWTRGRVRITENYKCAGPASGSTAPSHEYPGDPFTYDSLTVGRQARVNAACVNTGFSMLNHYWDVVATLSEPSTVPEAFSRTIYTEGEECTAYTGEETDTGRTLGGGVTYVEYYLQFDAAWEGQTVDIVVTYRTITIATSAIDDSLTDELTVVVPVGGEVGPIAIPQPPGGKTRSVLGITLA